MQRASEELWTIPDSTGKNPGGNCPLLVTPLSCTRLYLHEMHGHQVTTTTSSYIYTYTTANHTHVQWGEMSPKCLQSNWGFPLELEDICYYFQMHKYKWVKGPEDNQTKKFPGAEQEGILFRITFLLQWPGLLQGAASIKTEDTFKYTKDVPRVL